MKRIEDMSIEEMEGYFKKVDRIVHTFGKSYRILWPFPVLSPFSPTRFVLNVGVLFTWIIALQWLIVEREVSGDLGVHLVKLWGVTLTFSLILWIFERHYRIKIRYRRMMKQQYFQRGIPTARPVSGGSKQEERESPSDRSRDKKSEDSREGKEGKEGGGSGEEVDLREFGMDLLRKLFK